ncbi:MAG: carboxypeptidase-like regulatory domain-containing protein [Flavobacteriaceae bacterium]
MRFTVRLFLWLFQPFMINAQENHFLSGKILNNQSKEPLAHVRVAFEESQLLGQTDVNGFFKLPIDGEGEVILTISVVDFVTKRIPISLENQSLDLGILYLEPDVLVEQTDNLISLTDAELFDDQVSSNASGLLQATRDIFLNRAAFDFGQAFFRVRGYDAQNGKVLLNGIPMNKFFDGRPQWNNWGGLNDATRNQQFTHGLQPSEYNFGGILGTTNIDTRPSGLRPGTRLSSSASNRTYTGRLMVTHSSGLQKNRLAYSISASRRWAKEGYVDGSLYDAFSVFGAVEYRLNQDNSINFTGILASNRRGRSSAITEEVFHLMGNRYNPFWGEQNGKIRNSRERTIAEPILMLNHFYQSEKFKLNTGASYQFGTNSRSRLGYYNAPNPDPTYFRYLPSFYINSPIGANFISANTAREGFLDNPQLRWTDVYKANASETQNGKAAYLFYDDITKDRQITVNTIGNLALPHALKLDFGLTYRQLSSQNYAKIDDLLGARFHEDIDPFSDTLNDLNGETNKGQDAVFNYNYELSATQFDGFAQVRYGAKKYEAFAALNYATSSYKRMGFFLNQRFLNNSLGNSETLRFSNYGLKGGLTYKFNGRHVVILNGVYLNQPPALQNIFINPRENNQIVPEIHSEKITATDINYYLRLPKLTGRITGFYTRFQDATDINFFFVDAGVGSDFVQEVVTDLDKLHLGTEIGLEYQVSSTVQLSAVAAIGKYVYASNPSIAINFDTAGAVEDLINPDGNIDLGVANIKGYKLAQGPQQAFAFGINYRDPKYWWVGGTANYLANNFASISKITRTPSFYLDPETGRSFPEATEENVNKLLAQNAMDDFYLLNLVGGKSWLKKGKYISIFASINNVFDTVIRTGGFEQSRNGNFGQLQQDNLSGTPSFAAKYWYGYGRTYFLNVAYSF